MRYLFFVLLFFLLSSSLVHARCSYTDFIRDQESPSIRRAQTKEYCEIQAGVFVDSGVEISRLSRSRGIIISEIAQDALLDSGLVAKAGELLSFYGDGSVRTLTLAEETELNCGLVAAKNTQVHMIEGTNTIPRVFISAHPMEFSPGTILPEFSALFVRKKEDGSYVLTRFQDELEIEGKELDCSESL